MNRILLFLLCIQFFSSQSQNCGAFFSSTDSGLTVTFYDSSYSNFSNYTSYWEFGDSSNSTLRDPIHTYSTSGTYQVCLNIQDTSSCSSNYCDSVTVLAPCQAEFTYFIDSNNMVFFNNQSAATVNAQYEWDFGDSTFSTLKNPTHSYSSSGAFTITLTITDSLNNCSSVYFDSIYITPPPACAAGFTHSIIQDSLFITSTATHYSHLTYDFGDGLNSTLTDPIHIYSQSGVYVVCQTVQDSTSNCTSSFCDTISITIPPTCQAGFTVTNNQDSLFITNTASNYNSIVYHFGDGDTSSLSEPIHVYAQSGTYQVCQYILDSNTNCTDTFCDSIQIFIPPKCNAGFNYTISGDSVLFNHTALAYNRLIYYFGDGDSSMLENPIHVYQQSGSYIVEQIVFNDSTSCSDRFYDTITVNISQSCVAKYQIAIDTNKRGTLYLINVSTNDNSHRYYWTFGDGQTAIGRTPSHSYSNTGKYEICLNISDSLLNCNSTYCDTVGLDSNGNVLKSNGFFLKVIDGVFIGIKETTLLENTSLYPNPFKDFLQVELHTQYNSVSYSLYDMNGRIQKEGIIPNKKSRIELGSLAQGIYFIRLTNGQESLVRKLIKN